MNNKIPHREVWRIAWPMILSGLTIPLVGMVDTAVMGRLSGPEYIGAVALGSLVFSYVFFGLGFLRMGTTGLAAQAFGAGDTQALKLLFMRATVLALSLSALLYLFHYPLRELAFSVLEGSARVEAMGREYFDIRLYGMPAVLLRMVLVGWFLGVQDSRSPLYLLLLTNTANIALDIIFVLELHWQVAGVAWATVIAEYLGLLLGLWLWWRSPARAPQSVAWAVLLQWRGYLPMFKLNGNIFIRTLMLISCLAFFTAQGAQQSEAVLAANALLMNFMMFLAFGMDGLAHAAEALVGKLMGAGQRPQQAIRITACWSACFAVAYSLSYWLFSQELIQLMTTLESVSSAAEQYVPWLIALPLIASWGFWLDGVFIGAMWSRDMRNMMVLSCGLYLLIWWLTQGWGNHGLWFALSAWFALRGMTLGWVLPRRLRQSNNPRL